jgi:hypothetical protein
MEESSLQEQLSMAHLLATASAAGYTCQVPDVDHESVDRTIIARGRVEPDSLYLSPRIDVQMKSLRRDPLTRGERSFKYALKKKNYDDLRPEGPMVPRLLVVLLLPRSREHWVSHGERQTVLRHAAYYLSLHGMPERPGVRYTVTVELPRKNRFSVGSLTRLMGQASRGWRKLE